MGILQNAEVFRPSFLLVVKIMSAIFCLCRLAADMVQSSDGIVTGRDVRNVLSSKNLMTCKTRFFFFLKVTMFSQFPCS